MIISKIIINFILFSSHIIYSQSIGDPVILNEIVIKNGYFNVGYKVKKFSPAERKLHSSTGGFIGLINLLNGTLKTLKNNVTVEKKESAILKLEYQVDEGYFFSTLEISKKHIRGFLFYIVENKTILELLKQNNLELLKFNLIELSKEFKSCCAN